MSTPANTETCPASLDSTSALIFNHFNNTYLSHPPSLSMKTLASNGPPSMSVLKSNHLNRPLVRSPLGESLDGNMARPHSRASSFSGSVVIGRESRCGMHSTSHSYNLLPPIPLAPSLQFHSYLDFNFQSFTLSPSLNTPRTRRSSRLTEQPPALPPLPSLSQPLFPPSPEANITPHRDPFQIPSFSHPNSPYVPWDSPMRRKIFRPLTPDSSVSFLSEYSRPYSRSGAQAPEPTDIPEAENGRKLLRVSQSIRKMQRTVKKNVTGVAKRIFARPRHSKAECVADYSEYYTRNHAASDTHFPLPSLRSPTSASFDSSNTRSLAAWLEARRQETHEWDADSQRFLSLDEYERTGSWTNLPNGQTFVCGVPECSIHCTLSSISQEIDETTTHDSSILRLLLPSGTFSQWPESTSNSESKTHYLSGLNETIDT